MSSKAFELKYQLQGGFLCIVAECLKIRQGPVKKNPTYFNDLNLNLNSRLLVDTV